jgi:hypothetical protein
MLLTFRFSHLSYFWLKSIPFKISARSSAISTMLKFVNFHVMRNALQWKPFTACSTLCAVRQMLDGRIFFLVINEYITNDSCLIAVQKKNSGKGAYVCVKLEFAHSESEIGYVNECTSA